ncbi:MAG: hypothetical protein ACTHT9_02360 [Idiomarina loihiensis]
MKRLKSLSIFASVVTLLCVTASAAANQTVDITSIKNYDLALKTPIAVDNVELSPQLGQWRAGPGESLGIDNPFENAGIDMHIGNGHWVEKNAEIATLKGPSVEHFYHRLETIREQYQIATEQYQVKKKLYTQKAISSSDWRLFLSEYVVLSDNMHEVNVLLQRFTKTSADSTQLKAPASGLWRSSVQPNMLGHLIPASAMRIAVSVPSQYASNIRRLQVKGKSVAVELPEKISRNGYVTLWSEPVTDRDLYLDEVLNITPLVSLENAFKVPASAVSSINGKNVVFVVQNTSIQPITINIISIDNNDYFITSDSPITTDIATSSVAALKGIFDAQESEQ